MAADIRIPATIVIPLKTTVTPGEPGAGEVGAEIDLDWENLRVELEVTAAFT